MKSARHQARACSVQGIYQWLLSGDSPEDIEQHAREEVGFDKIDKDYFKTLFYAVLKDVPALTDQLLPFLDRPLAELSPVEHAILLVCIYELAKHDDIPYRVVINEGVELAKTFGSVDGYKYVNGVLNKAALCLRPKETKEAPRRLSKGNPAHLANAKGVNKESDPSTA